jgi:DtxR family Mn-dependent transcriptional regulator
MEHEEEGMSESEQMYLVTTAMLIEDGTEQPVPLPALAQARSIMPASVNQMVRKLADEGLVTYIPYKGIALTSQGNVIARRILRYRRLWEVFLVQKLGLGVVPADALACRLEHLTSDEVADRLSQYLGDPETSPQGKPIPKPVSEEEAEVALPLNQIHVGQRARVLKIEGEGMSRAFLESEGVMPGARLVLLALGSDGSVLIETGGRQTHLAAAVANQVVVLSLD